MKCVCACFCIHCNICIKVLWRLQAWLCSIPKMQQLLQQIWIMWASLMDICQTLILLGLNFLFSSTVFRLASFSTLASPVSLRNLLASRKKKKKMWKLVFRLTATSKLMLFCWFSAQEVESSWGPHSPNSPAVWCSHFILARIEERWCSAARPRDTHHPSTGNTYRHGFIHTFHYFCFSATHVTQRCRTTFAIKNQWRQMRKRNAESQTVYCWQHSASLPELVNMLRRSN